MSSLPPLPPAWVDKIFERMLVRYGSAWLRMWEGIDMAAVKEDWANELGGFIAYPENLAYGISKLPPDRPPTVQQFAAICNRSPPPPAPPMLEAPKADPVVVQKVKEAFTQKAESPTAWAQRLRLRELGGDRLTIFQRDAWRAVVRVEDR